MKGHSLASTSHCYLCSIVKPVFFFRPNVFQLPQNCSLHHHEQVTTLCVLHPSSSGIQACYNDPVMLCDRPGRALAVCVNPDQSLPLLDGQRHQRSERSQGVLKPGLMWWAGRSVLQVTDLSVINRHSRPMSKKEMVVRFCKGRIKRLAFFLPWNIVFDSPVAGRIQNVLRHFVVLIDIPVGKMSPQMPYIWQGLYSLMIRVNMAHGLHFYRRAGRNNTIAKIQPI